MTKKRRDDDVAKQTRVVIARNVEELELIADQNNYDSGSLSAETIKELARRGGSEESRLIMNVKLEKRAKAFWRSVLIRNRKLERGGK